MNSPHDPHEFPNYNDPLPAAPSSSEALYLETTVQPAGRPAVVTWYRLYAVFMALIYVACFIGGALMWRYKDYLAANSPGTSSTEFMVNAIMLIGIGIPLFVLYCVALILPNKPWTWIYHIVMIAIGLTSCCTWPATIPLLIFWLKPETQAYFGRNTTSTPPPPPANGPPPPIPSVP